MGMTEYERLREERIAKNKALLDSLAVHSLSRDIGDALRASQAQASGAQGPRAKGTPRARAPPQPKLAASGGSGRRSAR